MWIEQLEEYVRGPMRHEDTTTKIHKMIVHPAIKKQDWGSLYTWRDDTKNTPKESVWWVYYMGEENRKTEAEMDGWTVSTETWELSGQQMKAMPELAGGELSHILQLNIIPICNHYRPTYRMVYIDLSSDIIVWYSCLITHPTHSTCRKLSFSCICEISKVLNNFIQV